jgi:uncharacterized protein YfiM (DUF2279 family)
MDGVLHVAVLLASMGAAVSAESPRVGVAPTAVSARAMHPPIPSMVPVTVQQPADRWLGEDKFRHAGASWAAMVFTYAAARAIHDDRRAAIAVALPVTAALGLAKEAVDHRRGGPFSARDLAADALGAGAAWLVLREVR